MRYVATIQIEIDADGPADAADGINGAMYGLRERGKIGEWQYVKLGDQYLYPTEGGLPRYEG